MDSSPPGSSDCGILQAIILEWVAISFSRGSCWLKEIESISFTAGRFLTAEAPGKVVVATNGTIINKAYRNTSHFKLHYVHIHKIFKNRITHLTMMLFGFHSWERSPERRWRSQSWKRGLEPQSLCSFQRPHASYKLGFTDLFDGVNMQEGVIC